jgi:DNA polymerase-3 subunit epsilon
MVAGKSVDRDRLAAFVVNTDLVIAHHAEFDRPFCEGIWSGFEAIPWACSMKWSLGAKKASGVGGCPTSSLSLGCFYDARDAVDDSMALLFLAHWPFSPARPRAPGQPARLGYRPALRNEKDDLKARGYR